jgi:PTH1 family peptidyl-tRNA hydrolase
MDSPVRMVVGLGNPGREYEGTRHNVGFGVLDRLAQAAAVSFESRPRWQAASAKLPGGAWLLKPGTFMNLSGRAVQAAAAFFKLPPESLLVVFDDASLPLGTLRFRQAGSHGGHNGVRSIIESLGTDRFPRLKIGIGESGPGRMTGHVLGRFREDERDASENALARAVDAVQLALSQDVAAAANVYNTRTKPPKSESDEPEIRKPDHPRHQGD